MFYHFFQKESAWWCWHQKIIENLPNCQSTILFFFRSKIHQIFQKVFSDLFFLILELLIFWWNIFLIPNWIKFFIEIYSIDQLFLANLNIFIVLFNVFWIFQARSWFALCTMIFSHNSLANSIFKIFSLCTMQETHYLQCSILFANLSCVVKLKFRCRK